MQLLFMDASSFHIHITSNASKTLNQNFNKAWTHSHPFVKCKNAAVRVKLIKSLLSDDKNQFVLITAATAEITRGRRASALRGWLITVSPFSLHEVQIDSCIVNITQEDEDKRGWIWGQRELLSCLCCCPAVVNVRLRWRSRQLLVAFESSLYDVETVCESV